MSYCRWSSNNFDCDLYCYESKQGWVTHVAGSRVTGPIPKVDWTDAVSLGETMKAQMAYLNTAVREPIGLSYDGQSFTDGTLEEFRERVAMLIEDGYHIPDGILEDIDVEIRIANLGEKND